MAKRLQVNLKGQDYREIQRAARSRDMSVAEWVLQALESALRREPTGPIDKKLMVIRTATQHAYPVPDIGKMLEDIEKGYGQMST